MKLSVVAVILMLLYMVAMPMSCRGWGYPGYYGYHRAGSFWYMGGPSYYPGQSVRTGSAGGPGHRGGGPRGGK